MSKPGTHIIFNGELIPIDQASVPVHSRGLMYGDGCFESFKAYKGKFLKLEDHFNRLMQGCRYLGLEVHFGYEDFKSKLIELLEANCLVDEDAMVRVQCWREGERGYFSASEDASWVTTCAPINEKNHLIKLATVSVRAIPSQALERKYKLSNGLNYIQAAREAHALGADDALILTLDDYISESSTANLFWLKEKTIFTPSEDCDLLPGITRNLLIELISKQTEYSVEEGKYQIEHIQDADAVWVTNSIREIVPVLRVDETLFDISHPVIQMFKESFELYKLNNLS